MNIESLYRALVQALQHATGAIEPTPSSSIRRGRLTRSASTFSCDLLSPYFLRVFVFRTVFPRGVLIFVFVTVFPRRLLTTVFLTLRLLPNTIAFLR